LPLRERAGPRHPQTRAEPARGAAAAAGAAAGAAGALPTILSALGTIVGLDLPRWMHNLADLLQIGAALIALLARETARRGRR